MPVPRIIARLNRRVTNPALGRLAGRVPPFAMVVHRGRQSGRLYQTPVMAFPSREGVVIALTYGPGADWVRNVVADDGCHLVFQGREIPLTHPRLVTLATPPSTLPRPVRLILSLLRVLDFLLLTEAHAATTASPIKSTPIGG